MLTTKQTRNIMRTHGKQHMWTNISNTERVTDVRRVKCYGDSTDTQLIAALQEATGEHVSVNSDSIIVNATLSV